MSFEPAAGGPQCPRWCTAHSDTHGVHGSGVHGSVMRYGSDQIGVTIRQAGARNPVLYFGGVRIELCDAGLLASAMERLGHPDIAAAITDLAALADEPDRGSGQ
jgi:hypothetical protein